DRAGRRGRQGLARARAGPARRAAAARASRRRPRNLSRQHGRAAADASAPGPAAPEDGSMTDEEMRQHPAFREGIRAALGGEPVTANPYVPETESGWLWLEGQMHVERLRRGRGLRTRIYAH